MLWGGVGHFLLRLSDVGRWTLDVGDYRAWCEWSGDSAGVLESKALDQVVDIGPLRERYDMSDNLPLIQCRRPT